MDESVSPNLHYDQFQSFLSNWHCYYVSSSSGGGSGSGSGSGSGMVVIVGVVVVW